MKKNCLTCKYEPDWPAPKGKEYPRSCAPCKWDKELPPLPGVMVIRREFVTRYSDDSGVIEHCKAWEPKESNR
jgi:hypothetical protein